MCPYFIFGSPTTCTYCGNPAAEQDHVIPVSSQTDLKLIIERLRSKKLVGPVTYSCVECNYKLSTNTFPNFLARCQFISNTYSSKAKAVLWSLKQINALDYTLGSFILSERNKRLSYRVRADWIETRDFTLGLSNLKFEPVLSKNSPKFDPFLFNYFRSSLRLIESL